jgi:hypothetical protein
LKGIRSVFARFGLDHAPHRTALYRTRKRLSEEYLRLLNQKILEDLELAKKVGADATGLYQLRRDCTSSSTSEGGRREHVKLHALFNLDTRTVETFETTPRAAGVGGVAEAARREGPQGEGRSSPGHVVHRG